MKNIPPLKPLLTFVEVAEQQSFTKVAKKLNLTQGAVSKQISLLESYLKTELFERRHQTLKTKPKARTYAKLMREAFEKISKATQDVSVKSDSNTLTINILPSLTVEWVAPIMREFSSQYSVNIENGSGYDPINFNDIDADIAIRIGKKKQKWKGCKIENLIDEKLLFVCSPSYLKGRSTIKNPQDFLKHHLLENSSRPSLWKDYISSISSKTSDLKYKAKFEHLFMLLEAAKDGLGVAMLPDFMIKKEIKNGELVLANKSHFISGYSYQLIYPRHNSDSKKIMHFTKWAKQMMKKT